MSRLTSVLAVSLAVACFFGSSHYVTQLLEPIFCLQTCTNEFRFVLKVPHFVAFVALFSLALVLI